MMEGTELFGGKYCGHILKDNLVHFPDLSSGTQIEWIENDAFSVEGWIYRVANGEAKFVIQNKQIAII